MVRHLTPLIIGILGFCSASTMAMTQEHDHNSLHAAHGWAQETIPGSKNGAIYLTIHNPDAEADRLTGVASDVAERTEIHNSSNDNGVMRMSRLTSVDIPAGAHVVFAPGSGPHVMLIGVASPLKAGDIVKLRLSFESAGEFELEVPVITMAEAMEKTGHDPSHHQPGHGQKDHHQVD